MTRRNLFPRLLERFDAYTLVVFNPTSYHGVSSAVRRQG